MENNILSTLTKDEKSVLTVKTLKKKEILFKESQLCEYVGVLVSGELKISSYLFSGEELIFNIVKPSEMFGNNLLFSDSPVFKGDVIATKDSTVVLIDKNNLISIIQNNKEFMIYYLKIQNNFTKSLNSTIKLLSFDSAEKRFIYYLFINKNQIKFKSVQDLANLLHLKRETLSRLISKLKKEGVIERTSNKIRLIKINQLID